MTAQRPASANTPTVRAAFPGESDALTALVVDAFLPLPVNEWLVEDDVDRTFVLLDYFGILVDHALRHGVVEVIDGDESPAAMAAWLPPDAPAAPDDYAARLRAAAGVWTDRFELLDDALGGAHLEGHHRLTMLATRTGVQNMGLGSWLLARRLAELESREEPACLETASPRSIPLYTRYGFVPYGDPITVASRPDQAMTPMRRSPLWAPPAEAAQRPATQPSGTRRPAERRS